MTDRPAAPVLLYLNCAAVPAELIESAIFGHEKAPSPGPPRSMRENSSRPKAGHFSSMRSAICPWPCKPNYCASSKRARVERVGGEKPVRVNVRVVVATHRNLEKLVKADGFRQDLFHRVYVFPLRLPSLRERPEDLPELIAHFARQVAAQNNWREKQFESPAIDELKRYSWPGNVRELRNVVERLVLISNGESVTEDDVHVVLPAAMATHAVSEGAATASGELRSGTLAERSEAFERETLLAEIRRHNFHMTNVARDLGLERSHLYKKCQQLGIDLQAIRKPA